MSRRHLELQLEDEPRLRYAMADLGSRNGTQLRGAPIRCGTIEPGEFFAIGDVELQLLPPGKYETSGRVFLSPGRWAIATEPIRAEHSPVPPTERASGLESFKESPRRGVGGARWTAVFVLSLIILVIILTTLVLLGVLRLSSLGLGDG